MKIIIPMVGSGQRFVDAGYKEPKPFIKVRGRYMLEYICDMFDKENDEFIFICNNNHYTDPNVKKVLENIVTNYHIIPVPINKLGPVFSVLTACPPIDDNEPIIISYCDTSFTWDYDDFKRCIKDKDGCIVSCTGFHPHSLSSTLMAHSKTDNDDKVLAVKEKGYFTDNHFNEHASCGVYYFRRGEYVSKYFEETLDNNLSYGSEFYVTLVYNLMIRDGLSVYSYLCDYVLQLGTPQEVHNFKAWMTIVDGEQVKDKHNLLDCYNYWKRYRHETENNIT